LLRQDTLSAESRFAWIVLLTKTITNVPFGKGNNQQEESSGIELPGAHHPNLGKAFGATLMGFNWDMAASVGFFVGLLAVYAALLQLAHLRHHELSLECFRMREAVTALAERIRSLKVSRDLTEESGRSLSGLQEDFDANLSALSASGMVFERYLSATRAIKAVACGLAVTLFIGLVLGCGLLSVLHAWAWIPVIALLVSPAFLGTWHLVLNQA